MLHAQGTHKGDPKGEQYSSTEGEHATKQVQ